MLSLTLLCLGAVPAPQDDDLALRARAVLEARCLPCHGPDSEDKGAVRSWPDALDVAAAIEDEILVPGDAEGSYLWELVAAGDMPPEDSPSGHLTEEERATLAAWIDGGARVAPAEEEQDPERDPDWVESLGTVPTEVAPTEEPETGADPPGEAAEPAQDDAFDWDQLGRLHPMVVHFPIGLLLAAVAAELLVGLGASRLRTAARFCAWLGTLGAGVASYLGWVLAEGAVKNEELLETHRWLGIASAGTGLLLALSLEARARSRGSRAVHVLLVLATGALVGLAGHWGGMLTWGRGHLDFLQGLWAGLVG